MRYQIIRREKTKYGNDKYTVDLDLDEHETLDKEVLLQELDYPFSAPFGGNVKLLPSGLIEVEIYKD